MKNSKWLFPFSITRNRVSEEDAPVQILDQTHRIFNYPNRITQEDFKGWFQERSLYEVALQDSSYIPLISMHDKGDEPRSGSLVFSKIGKGNIIYTSLSFFRQLPEGIPGAYRLFANLLAKP
jgi:hypothetical protein